MQFRF
jgi:hypothetical protein